MDFQYIAELPQGYEYKLVRVEGQIRIIGAAHDKPPIGFILEENHRLIAIDLNVNGFK